MTIGHFSFQICDTTPFVSELQELSVLDTEYSDDPIYSSKLKYLTSKYKSIRKTRPDGNCFFRAFSYAYLEYLVKNKDDYEPFRALSEESKDRLIKLGFPQFTLEDFHDTVSLNSSNFISFMHDNSLEFKCNGNAKASILIHQQFF